MRKEETVDHCIKTAWHAISRMYNQQAWKHDITTAIGFVLLNIHSEQGTAATKIAPLMGMEARSLTRTLKTMERYGLVQIKRGIRGSVVPKVSYQKISLVLPLSRSMHDRPAA